MMGEEFDNANVEGESAGTVSIGEPTERGAFKAANPFGESTARGGDRGGKLFADPGLDSRGIDFGDGDTETTKRKRGRPKGSKSGGIAKLTGDKLVAARRKLTDTLAGVVGFGVSYYGINRANKYKQVSPELARHVYACYQLNKEQAVSVGEPLADTFITWFPQYVETTTKAIDPGLAVARLFTIFQQATENEKFVVERFKHQTATTPPPQAPTNGAHPEPDIQRAEEASSEWQQQNHPQPEDLIYQPQPTQQSPSD